ncbi:hypothetical protein EON65_30310 [archaeon]|nr:MAG: hypothetical protein EON65_30310 [archaeon]
MLNKHTLSYLFAGICMCTVVLLLYLGLNPIIAHLRLFYYKLYLGKKKAGTGVVSTRAIKHIQNLITLCSNSNTHKAALVFIVNRSDCDAFRPCHEACMLFSQMLYRASLCENIDIMAVEVEYVTTNVAADGETVEKDSEVSSSHWDGHVNFVAKITRELPVLIAKVVMDKPVDEDHLRRVLEAAE